MKSNQEIIADALAVRDDGAQPRCEAAEYEQVLLALARQDEGFAEDGIAQALARIAAGTNEEANALIFAADRKRDAEAAAAVGKSAPLAKSAPSSAVATDAERCAKGAAPTFTRAQYEDEMMALSKAAARSGESPAVAFARLASEGHFDALYAASVQADEHEHAEAMSKAAPSDDGRFHRLLVDMAACRKNEGETIEAAYVRLLTTDQVVMDAYASTQGA